MKLFLVLAVVLIGAWLWRSSRRTNASRNKPPAPPLQPQDMVRCALCDLHIPQADAITGQKGVYCCAAHRQRAEP